MTDTAQALTRASLVKMVADSIATLHGKSDPEYGVAEAEAIADTLYLGGFVNERPACPAERSRAARAAQAKTYAASTKGGATVNHSPVHNHGPSDGRGLDCNERRTADGSLRGTCLPDAARDRRPLVAPIKVEVSYPWAS